MKTLIIGYASNVLDDVAKVKFSDFDYVIAVNRAITLFPKADIWITLHPEYFADWEPDDLSPETKIVTFDRTRNALGNVIKYEVDEVFPYLFDGQENSGSSGLYAVKYSIEVLNSTETVLAGIPMDPSLPHHGESDPWSTDEFWETWVNMADHLRSNNVRSLSGRTSELLG